MALLVAFAINFVGPKDLRIAIFRSERPTQRFIQSRTSVRKQESLTSNQIARNIENGGYPHPQRTQRTIFSFHSENFDEAIVPDLISRTSTNLHLLVALEFGGPLKEPPSEWLIINGDAAISLGQTEQ